MRAENIVNTKMTTMRTLRKKLDDPTHAPDPDPDLDPVPASALDPALTLVPAPMPMRVAKIVKAMTTTTTIQHKTVRYWQHTHATQTH